MDEKKTPKKSLIDLTDQLRQHGISPSSAASAIGNNTVDNRRGRRVKHLFDLRISNDHSNGIGKTTKNQQKTNFVSNDSKWKILRESIITVER